MVFILNHLQPFNFKSILFWQFSAGSDTHLLSATRAIGSTTCLMAAASTNGAPATNTTATTNLASRKATGSSRRHEVTSIRWAANLIKLKWTSKNIFRPGCVESSLASFTQSGCIDGNCMDCIDVWYSLTVPGSPRNPKCRAH